MIPEESTTPATLCERSKVFRQVSLRSLQYLLMEMKLYYIYKAKGKVYSALYYYYKLL
jgi:hypothetical protein